MTIINMKDFYYWYTGDELIEVPDEVAEELLAGKRWEAAYAERVRYNKAYYSLDCNDGIEYSSCLRDPYRRNLWSGRCYFASCGMLLIPCRKSKGAEWMRMCCLAKVSGRSPAKKA